MSPHFMISVSYPEIMKSSPFYIAKLLIKKFREDLTEEEGTLLSDWTDRDPRNKALLTDLKKRSSEGIDTSIFNSFDEQEAWKSILRRQKQTSTLTLWKSIAAVLAVLISLSFYFLVNQSDSSSERIVESKNVKYKNDVLPAIKGAKLIRTDGSEIKVEDNIHFLADGRISTSSSDIIADEEELPATQNTLVVPAANFISLTLGDGTKVWVNANSRLNFPSKFAANERRVELEGEAYFEVAKDSARPFYVKSKGAEIKVLGTHFNVMAYSNQVTTTLEEGRVEVSKGDKKVVLIPGQRADIYNDAINVQPADLYKVLAWKNNIFYFKGDNIVEIAQQLQSWYDLEVSISKDVSQSQTYTGEIRRDANLSEVLNMLEFVSDLSFKINQNKLSISKRKL
ncbi:FecR family protein [Solitalea lacus]|uniref:FecR family protein n=1 Tax=Solitalea lacus TaxID=2911172 RepID=UPI001EDBEC02|nr:FecR domain-containing protein [Solitalea lacus]UKJ09246.1 FecR domain-containing protein [Solitalea lacus]